VRHLSLLCIPLLLAWSEPAPAQGAQDSVADRQAAPLCYRARPKPACSAFILTNFGGYLVLGGDESNDTPLREVADWGVMANVSARDALGASVFASLDRLGFALGPAVRYRRWLSSLASLDLAVGTPLVTGAGNMQTGSVFGLVRWSPSRGRVSLGVEFAGVPGLALTTAGGIATLLLAMAIAAGGN